LDDQKHFIRRLTDKVVEGAKKIKQLFLASLCALVRQPTDEIVYFFIASNGWDGADGLKLLLTSWGTAVLASTLQTRRRRPKTALAISDSGDVSHEFAS
jgi:hypothetical protein